MKFADLLLEGKATLNDIDDYIEEWHNNESDEPIYDFLGLTREQYSFYVEGKLDNLSKEEIKAIMK